MPYITDNYIMKKSLFFKYLFLFTVLMTTIQQLPIIYENFYTPIRLLIYMNFLVLVVKSLTSFKTSMKNEFIRLYTIVIIISTTIFFIYMLVGLRSEFMELLIPYTVLIITMSFDFSNREKKRFIILYIIFVLIMSVSNIFYYIGGFKITNLYEIPGKNQIGAIIGSSLIILGIIIIRNSFKNISLKYFSYIAFTVLFICLLAIRNRASIIAIIFVLAIYILLTIFKRITIKKVITIIFILIGLIILMVSGALLPIIHIFWESLTLNFDTTNINSFSSGRTDTYISAFVQFLERPLFGELFGQSNLTNTPHNYLLNKLVRYGLIGSLPIIILYFYIVYFTLQGILVNRDNIVYWLFLYALIISQFEYTYPFGPGATQIIIWVILGIYLKEKINKVI